MPPPKDPDKKKIWKEKLSIRAIKQWENLKDDRLKPGESHYNYKHGKYSKIKPKEKLCMCGCGLYAKPGNKFINGHNIKRIKKTNTCNLCKNECSGNLCWKCYLESKRLKLYCNNCGETIYKIKCYKNKNNFCSLECYYEWKKKQRNNKIDVKCDYCNKLLKKYPSQINKTNFCNKNCQGKYKSILTKDKYTVVKNRIKNSIEYLNWRKRVFERDNYSCVNCKSKEFLHCHHIKPFNIIFNEFISQYDIYKIDYMVKESKKYKEFWDLNNGICLCYKCHEDIHPELTFQYGGLNYAPSTPKHTNRE